MCAWVVGVEGAGGSGAAAVLLLVVLLQQQQQGGVRVAVIVLSLLTRCSWCSWWPARQNHEVQQAQHTCGRAKRKHSFPCYHSMIPPVVGDAGGTARWQQGLSEAMNIW